MIINKLFYTFLLIFVIGVVSIKVTDGDNYAVQLIEAGMCVLGAVGWIVCLFVKIWI